MAMLTTCPICDRSGDRHLHADGFWIRRCDACQHCFVESGGTRETVTQLYGDDYFFGGGSGYPDYLAERELLIEHGRRYGQLLRTYAPPGRLLDVGAAAGFILEGFRQSGWDASGIEPNQRLSAYAREHLGLNVETGTFEDHQPSDRYDVLTFIQVVSHFYDLGQAFRVAEAITRPGGLWLIETWNHRSAMARLLGRRWHEWSPPSVRQWFSPESLAKLGVRFGMDVIGYGRPRKRLSGEHVKSLLRHRLRASRFSTVMNHALRFTVPDQLTVPYPSNDLFWLILRKVD